MLKRKSEHQISSSSSAATQAVNQPDYHRAKRECAMVHQFTRTRSIKPLATRIKEQVLSKLDPEDPTHKLILELEKLSSEAITEADEAKIFNDALVEGIEEYRQVLDEKNIPGLIRDFARDLILKHIEKTSTDPAQYKELLDLFTPASAKEFTIPELLSSSTSSSPSSCKM